MSFAQNIDWTKEIDGETYENVGRQILYGSCKHKDGISKNDYCDKCGISEDSAIPMMNYIYPLETTPEEEDILKVVKNTNCTIVEIEGEYFLTLCGGGMDLSQDIALAYILSEKWIPEDFITQISNQKGLSISEKNFEILRKEVIEQSKVYAERFQDNATKWI